MATSFWRGPSCTTCNGPPTSPRRTTPTPRTSTSSAGSSHPRPHPQHLRQPIALEGPATHHPAVPTGPARRLRAESRPHGDRPQPRESAGLLRSQGRGAARAMGGSEDVCSLGEDAATGEVAGEGRGESKFVGHPFVFLGHGGDLQYW